MGALLRFALTAIIVVAASVAPAAADEARGTVVDPTSAPLPGVTVQLFEGSRAVRSTTTGADGRFALGACPSGSRVTASLAGFDPVTVPCAQSSRIVLPLRGLTETLDVTASAVTADSPTSLLVGAELSRATMQRLPAATPHTRDALPLLPAVVRGADGLLHIDGVRPHDSPLLVDGFNVTDPASGVSSIDLPLESVRGTEVLRDPMTVTFGGALGSLASIETRTGGESFAGGIQSFVPRPRLTGGGFGRIEGFSPRGFASGSAGSTKYLISAEYDFDRIPVPGVTTSSGTPDTRQTGGSVFGRADVRLSAADSLTAEGILFPRTQRLRGLSPLWSIEAAPTLRERDLFGGVVGRHAFDRDSILTLRLGLLWHRMELGPAAPGEAEIAPSGRSGGFFSTIDRRATRLEAGASWQKEIESSRGVHDLTVSLTGERRELSGSIAEQTVDVRDADGRLVRSIRFGLPGTLAAEDSALGVALRDLWRPGAGLQIDAGLRGDTTELGGFVPSGRVGLRWSLGDDGTVIKGGLGTFVGNVPLAAAAFGGFPSRFDTGTDGDGTPRVLPLVPRVGSLALPRALASNLRVERRVGGSWDAMLGVGARRASRLATLTIDEANGRLLVASTGRSTYREAEVALRHTWGEGGQLFASYTRSSAHGEVNDFSTLFASGDIEVLRPGGVARLGSDAPNRLLAWATVPLPAGFGVSPALEWRSGFPYSVVDGRQEYAGAPNTASFPAFFSLDLVVDKAVRIKGKRVKLQVQLFNATNHFNPRDVFAVAGAPRFGSFVNSVGPTVRGDIGVDW